MDTSRARFSFPDRGENRCSFAFYAGDCTRPDTSRATASADRRQPPACDDLEQRLKMTQDDFDNGRLICLIGVALVKPAEIVIFRISPGDGRPPISASLGMGRLNPF